jgi:hypothetical protein
VKGDGENYGCLNEFPKLYSAVVIKLGIINTTREHTVSRKGWTGNSYQSWIRKASGEREFWRPAFMCEDIIKLDVKEIIDLVSVGIQ